MGRIVAVWASVRDGVYGEDVGVVEALVMVWVESKGRYGVRGRKGRGFSFFLSENLWVWGSDRENMIVFR